MELWIRSQDKEKLIKADKLYVEFNGDVDPMLKPYRIVVDKFIGLGIYKSKERALEVLDEINNFMLCNKEVKYSGVVSINELTNCYLYEMPKE